MSKLTDADYAEMAADYAENPVTAEEVAGRVDVDTAVLRAGRPARGSVSRGKTPTTSVRLPDPLRRAVDRLAASTEVKPAEIIRRAVGEYVERNGNPARPPTTRPLAAPTPGAPTPAAPAHPDRYTAL